MVKYEVCLVLSEHGTMYKSEYNSLKATLAAQSELKEEHPTAHMIFVRRYTGNTFCVLHKYTWRGGGMLQS